MGAWKGVVNGAVKFTVPLLATKIVLKLPLPNRTGNGDSIAAEASLSRFRLVPAMVR